MSVENKESITAAIVEINSNCNFRCHGCYMIQNDALNKNELMVPKEVEKIIKIAQPLSVDVLGGEPLLSPHFKKIIESCISNGVTPWVFSNLSLMDTKMAKFLFDNNVHVTGKLDIGNPEDPAQLELQAKLINRDRSVVLKMIKGIDTMLKVGYRQPLFSLQNLVRKENIDFAPSFVRWCLQNDITPDLELPACSNSESEKYYFENIAPESNNIKTLISKLYQVHSEFGINDVILPPHISGKGICRFKYEGLYFKKQDGKIAMQPCSSNTTHLGFLDDRQSIVSALKTPVMETRRSLDKLYKEGKITGICGQCEDFVDLCRGGCRATAENLSGPTSSYPLCWRD